MCVRDGAQSMATLHMESRKQLMEMESVLRAVNNMHVLALTYLHIRLSC